MVRLAFGRTKSTWTRLCLEENSIKSFISLLSPGITSSSVSSIKKQSNYFVNTMNKFHYLPATSCGVSLSCTTRLALNGLGSFDRVCLSSASIDDCPKLSSVESSMVRTSSDNSPVEGEITTVSLIKPKSLPLLGNDWPASSISQTKTGTLFSSTPSWNKLGKIEYNKQIKNGLNLPGISLLVLYKKLRL